MFGTIGNIITRRSLLNGAGAVIVALGMVITGCASGGDRVLTPTLESRLAGNGNADDHKAAAVFYDEQAQWLDAEAFRYEQRAAALRRQWMDPKGFRLSGLLTIAGENRKRAAEVRERSAIHHTKALTMMGEQTSQ